MDFYKLSNSDKLAMLNLTAALVNLKAIKINPDQFHDEDIIDALVEQAEYLLNKSRLLQKP